MVILLCPTDNKIYTTKIIDKRQNNFLNIFVYHFFFHKITYKTKKRLLGIKTQQSKYQFYTHFLTNQLSVMD